MEHTACTELTCKVLEYQHLCSEKTGNTEQKETQETANTLYTQILAYCEHQIYQYPVKLRILAPEDASDFLLKFLPRLESLILGFNFGQLSFENYLRKMIYLQANTYNHRKHEYERRFGLEMIDPEIIERTVVDSSVATSPYATPDC